MNSHDLLCALPALALSGELSGTIERLAQRLIRHAAQRAPAALVARLEEEWLADCVARPHALARLRLALGCCWAIRIIAHEHATVTAPAASAAVGSKAMTTFMQHDTTFFSRRSAAALLIIGLHVALVYLLANALMHTKAEAPAPDIHIKIVDDPRRPPPEAPPPSTPDFKNTKIDKIDSEVQIDSDTASDAIQPTPVQPAKPITAPALTIVRVPGGPGAGFPNTADYYPPAAIRGREEGSATIRVCVDARGRLTAAPALAGSSGFPRLDEAAMRLAKAGSGHYRPTTEDGRAVDSCYPFGVRFRLQSN